MPGILNEWQQFAHARTTNARLSPLEPQRLYRHELEKVIAPGDTWQPTGVPASGAVSWQHQGSVAGPWADWAFHLVRAVLAPPDAGPALAFCASCQTPCLVGLPVLGVAAGTPGRRPGPDGHTPAGLPVLAGLPALAVAAGTPATPAAPAGFAASDGRRRPCLRHGVFPRPAGGLHGGAGGRPGGDAARLCPRRRRRLPVRRGRRPRTTGRQRLVPPPPTPDRGGRAGVGRAPVSASPTRRSRSARATGGVYCCLSWR